MLLKKLNHIALMASIYGSLSVGIDLKSKKIQILGSRRVFFAVVSMILFFGLITSTTSEEYNSESSNGVERAYVSGCTLILIVICGSMPFWWYLQSDRIIKLWKELIQIDKDGKELMLRCKLRKYWTLLPTCIPYCVNTILSIYGILQNADMNSYDDYVILFANLLAYYVQGLALIQYSTLFITFRKYFQQLNVSLETIFQDRNETRIILLKRLADVHQRFCDLCNLTTTIFAVPLLGLIAQAVVSITKAGFSILASSLNGTIDGLLIAINAYWALLWIIILWSILSPSELCMKSVSSTKLELC